MKVFILIICAGIGLTCSSSSVGSAPPFLAVILSDGTFSTVGPFHHVQNFSAKGTEPKELFAPNESGNVFILPDEQGFFLLGEKSATFVDGSNRYTPFSLPMTDKKFVGAVMPTVGNSTTVTETGLLEHWQQDQKIGSDQNLALPPNASPLQRGVFSSDGSLLVTFSSQRKEVFLWDAANGSLLALLMGSSSSVQSMAVQSGKSYILAGSADGIARMWVLSPSNPPVLFLEAAGHEQGVLSVAFSHQGNFFVTGDGKGTVRLWEYAPDVFLAPRVKQVFYNHQTAVQSVSFSPDDQSIISTAVDGTLWVRDNPAEQAYVMKSPNVLFRTADLDPKGEWVVTTSPDKLIRLWKLSEVKAQGSLSIPRNQFFVNSLGNRTQVFSATFSPDGNLLVTEHDDGWGRIWDISGRENLALTQSPPLLGFLRSHQAPVRHITFSTDGAYIMTASEDRTAKIWLAQGLSKGSLLSTLSGHLDEVTSAVFSTDGHLAATTSRDKSIILWDLQDIKNPKKLSQWFLSNAVQGAIFAKGQIISADSTGLIQFWDLQNLQAPSLITSFFGSRLEGRTFPIQALASCRGEQQFITASQSWMYQLWDSSSHQLLSELIPLSISEPASVFAIDVATQQDFVAITTESAVLFEQLFVISDGLTLNLQ